MQTWIVAVPVTVRRADAVDDYLEPPDLNQIRYYVDAETAEEAVVHVGLAMVGASQVPDPSAS
jgi:hypothetical protein